MISLNIEMHRLTREKYKSKPGHSKTQSRHFWKKNPKELRSENMECLALPYNKNFKTFKLFQSHYQMLGW